MVNESSLNSGSQAALEELNPVHSGPKRITEHGGLELWELSQGMRRIVAGLIFPVVPGTPCKMIDSTGNL
jgi:hypothetical protein